jgi:hypothetical protein
MVKKSRLVKSMLNSRKPSNLTQRPRLSCFKLTKASPRSAGGGGKNNKRMEKLRIKNERLTEQRRRKMEVSAKQMERRAAKNAEGEDQDGEKEVVAEEKDDQSGMHPSRRAQLQKY